MPRYRLTLAYDGTNLHGWQKQAPGVWPLDAASPQQTRPLRTAQGLLEEAICRTFRTPINVIGASRTDAGVHARAQTAAFTCDEQTPRPPDERLAQALNARLPDDVLVLDCRRTHDDFDPIRSCLSKGYRYCLHVGPQRPMWRRRWVHHLWTPLDRDAMKEAAQRFVGEHDFAAFAKAGHGRLSTIRTVLACDVVEHERDVIALDISGTGFLHNMVRIIAGTLVEIGRGRLSPADVDAALATGDRRRAGPTLPPHGLCLQWIQYPDDPPAASVSASRRTTRAPDSAPAADEPYDR